MVRFKTDHNFPPFRIVKILNHILVAAAVPVKISPNMGGFFPDGLPDTIVIHYTAGPTAKSAIDTLTNPANSVSTHVVVDRDGSITQLVPFNRIAWHAGKSFHKNRSGLNSFSIGIEIVNAGRLKQEGLRFVSWFGKSYPEDEVIFATHKNESKSSYWHKFTVAQIDATFQLCMSLKERYSINYILGHDEIAPGRKVDPGPAFPIEKLRDNVLSKDRIK